MRGLLPAVLTCAIGCAASGRPPAPIPPNTTIWSDEDPRPFIPRPDRDDQTVLTTGGSEDQARRMALALIQALLDGDASAVTPLWAPQVSMVRGNLLMSREEATGHCMKQARRMQWQADLRIEDVVDVATLKVERVDRVYRGTLPISALRPGDLAVQMSARPRGGAPRSGSPFPCVSGVFVRPGMHPMIVALLR